MSGDAGEDIKAAGLDEIAQGITLVLGELKDLGIDSLAGAGRGFSNSPSPGWSWATRSCCRGSRRSANAGSGACARW